MMHSVVQISVVFFVRKHSVVFCICFITVFICCSVDEMCGKEHIAEQQLCKVVLCKAIILVC